MRTGTRVKAAVQPVSLPSSRTETWGKLPGSLARLCARFLALVSWSSCLCGRPWPLAFYSGSVCLSGLVVCSWPCCVVWIRSPGLFLSVSLKEVTTQGTDPRTDLLAGIPKYVRFTWPWDRLLGNCYYLFPIVSSCVFSPPSLLALFDHRPGPVEEPPRAERALRGGCSFFRFYRPSSQRDPR